MFRNSLQRIFQNKHHLGIVFFKIDKTKAISNNESVRSNNRSEGFVGDTVSCDQTLAALRLGDHGVRAGVHQ